MDLETRTTELLQRLIRFDTVNPPGNEQACQEFLRDLLEGAGFEVELLSAVEGRPNLVARLPSGRDGPTLCYLGHVDTVLATASEWEVDPWSGELRDDGCVWGRGALDMKSQVAAEAAAAVALAEEGWRPEAGELKLVFTADEEAGAEFGAQWLCERSPRRCAPTSSSTRARASGPGADRAAGGGHRVPGLRRGFGEVPALAGHHHLAAGARRTGCARRFGGGGGQRISVFYDPMISKLSVWAPDRPAAIDCMRRALDEYHVGGIKTNLAFHRQVMRHEGFAAGDYDTGYIEKHKAALTPAGRPAGGAGGRGHRRGPARRPPGAGRPAAAASGRGSGISAWRRELLREK